MAMPASTLAHLLRLSAEEATEILAKPPDERHRRLSLQPVQFEKPPSFSADEPRPTALALPEISADEIAQKRRRLTPAQQQVLASLPDADQSKLLALPSMLLANLLGLPSLTQQLPAVLTLAPEQQVRRRDSPSQPRSSPPFNPRIAI